MRTLTIGEEIQILKTIPILRDIDAGSSRIVYNCSEELASFLKLDMDRQWVIKLSVGSGGFVQKMHEIDTFINHDSYYFAEIAAYGHFVEIMEKVRTENYYELAESIDFDSDPEEAVDYYCEYNWEDADEEDKKRLQKVAFTIIYLADIFGSTSDNGQVGLTSDGRYVAYDYGFIAEEGCDTQCSSELIDNVYGDEEILKDYLCKLISILHEILHVNLELDTIISRVSDTEILINDEHRY